MFFTSMFIPPPGIIINNDCTRRLFEFIRDLVFIFVMMLYTWRLCKTDHNLRQYSNISLLKKLRLPHNTCTYVTGKLVLSPMIADLIFSPNTQG